MIVKRKNIPVISTMALVGGVILFMYPINRIIERDIAIRKSNVRSYIQIEQMFTSYESSGGIERLVGEGSQAFDRLMKLKQKKDSLELLPEIREYKKLFNPYEGYIPYAGAVFMAGGLIGLMDWRRDVRKRKRNYQL